MATIPTPPFIEALNEALKKRQKKTLTAIHDDKPGHWARPLSYTVNSDGQVITLNLKGAGLAELPITAAWQQIQRLDISRNRFTTLQLNGQLLPELELLEASYNEVPLEKLVFGGAFAKLRYLYVYDSKLRGIDFKQGLPALLAKDDSDLNLQENSLADDLLEILQEEDPTERRRRLGLYFGQTMTYVKRAKLILLGNTDTGKTTLHDMLMEPSKAKAGTSTHGINIFDYATTGSAPTAIKGFDFGGQDYYHSTHFSFFANNALYLLLWGKGQPDGWGSVQRELEGGGTRQETIYPRSYWLGAVQHYLQQYGENKRPANDLADGPAQDLESKTTAPSDKDGLQLHLLHNPRNGDTDSVWLNQHDIKTKYSFVSGFHEYCLATESRAAMQAWIDELVQRFAVAKPYPANGRNVAQVLAEHKTDVLLAKAALQKKPAVENIPAEALEELLRGLHALQDGYYLAPVALDAKALELLREDERPCLSLYLITDLDAFTNWVYAILGPESMGDGYFNEAQAAERLQKAGHDRALLPGHLQYLLAFMLYHKIIFRVKGDDRYIAPNYLPPVLSAAEILFLDSFEAPLVQYEFNGFFHSNVLTEILARYIQHKVPVQQEAQNPDGNNKQAGTALRYVLWKNKVLLCEEDTAANRPLERRKLLLLDFAPPRQQVTNKPVDEPEGRPKADALHFDKDKQKAKAPPMPGDRLPVIRLHRFANSQVSEVFLRGVMDEIETIIKGYDYTQWLLTPSQQSYIPLDALDEGKRMKQDGQPTGLVHYNNVLYRLGDFKLFVKNPTDFAMKKIFISYSKQDLAMVHQFQKHLAPLERSGLIAQWYCTELMAGSEWDATIQAHFDAADIICFMVSPNFNATDYIYEYELKKAFERRQQPGAKPLKIVPVIMRHCIWAMPGPYNLGQFSALPYTAKPVADFRDPDMAWLIVAEGIRVLCQHYDSVDPQEDDYYKDWAYANKDKLGKQLQQLFERIVAGKVDNNG
jgi:internalin A